MKQIKKKIRSGLISISRVMPSACIVLAMSMVFPVSAQLFENASKSDHKSVQTVRGVSVTGPNRFCGKIRWSFEEQGISPLSFRQVGAYVPGAEVPDELNDENCTRTQILATIHDTTISNDPPAIVQAPPTQLQNIPLRDVPKIPGILQGGTTGLRTIIERDPEPNANPFPIHASSSSQDITLGKWASARGRLSYVCRENGTSVVNINFANLIANGVYSMWGIWKTALPDGAQVDLPVPFGGVPNALVPDKSGRASFYRVLPFCPDSETEDGSLLLWVALAFHSDASLYAGVPDAADLNSTFVNIAGETFQSNLSLLVHHEQLAFPINFTERLN